jgi:hypothetical protein
MKPFIICLPVTAKSYNAEVFAQNLRGRTFENLKDAANAVLCFDPPGEKALIYDLAAFADACNYEIGFDLANYFITYVTLKEGL